MSSGPDMPNTHLLAALSLANPDFDICCLLSVICTSKHLKLY